MGFRDDIDNDKQNGDFYKFKEGEQRFRLFAEPVKKISRWGHGLCYPGALYCDSQVMEQEYNVKVEEAKKAGMDEKKVEKPSLSYKYMTWALLRGPEGKDRFVILDLPKQLAEKLRAWMDSSEYGFTGFPMPYDILIHADENVGSTKVKYDIQAARKETPVTDDELEKFSKLTPISQILEVMLNKQKSRVENGDTNTDKVEYPDGPDPEDIPF